MKHRHVPLAALVVAAFVPAPAEALFFNFNLARLQEAARRAALERQRQLQRLARLPVQRPASPPASSAAPPTRLLTMPSAPPPSDLPGRMAEEAREIAKRLWSKLPRHITGSPHANYQAFLEGAYAFGRSVAPELLGTVGIRGPQDWERGREGAMGLLGLRMEGYVNRHASRITTIQQVIQRIDQVRNQVWNAIPAEARFDRGSFDREFDGLRASMAGKIASRFPEGANSPETQRSAVDYALREVESFAKGYAERKLNEWRARKEAEERARRQPENCNRTGKVCHPWVKCCCGRVWPPRLPRCETYQQCHTIHYQDPACLARNAWKAATGWISDLWNNLRNLVSRAWGAITNLAQGAWQGIKNAAKWVGDRVKDVAMFACNAVGSVSGLLLKFKLDCEQLFRDPVGYLWGLLRDKILQPAVDFIRRPIEEAKKALANLIDQAKNAASGLLREQVLVPAIRWAVNKIFGDRAFDKLMDVARKVLGNVERLVQQAQSVNAALRALAERNLRKFDAAMADYRKEIERLKEMRVSGVVNAVADYARDRLVEFIRAKATGLLNSALNAIEAPINIGKSAAVAGLGSIPFAGGVLAGAADFILTEGLKVLRRLAVDFVVGKVTEFANPFLDKVAGFLKAQGTRLEAWLQPVFDAVRPVLADIQSRIGQVVGAYEKLSENLARARARIAQVAGAAGGGR